MFIKYSDKWSGSFYLKEDLTFTEDRNNASKFYLLKTGNTLILNGDRITINFGNKVLCIDDDNSLKLIDREFVSIKNSIIVTNGTDSSNSVSYNDNLFLITDPIKQLFLKCEWNTDSVNSIKTTVNTKTQRKLILVNSTYNANKDPFIFSFENPDNALTNSNHVKNVINLAKIQQNQNYGFKWFILLVLLIILLVLSVIVNK
jgi:hypothetical protein